MSAIQHRDSDGIIYDHSAWLYLWYDRPTRSRKAAIEHAKAVINKLFSNVDAISQHHPSTSKMKELMAALNRALFNGKIAQHADSRWDGSMGPNSYGDCTAERLHGPTKKLCRVKIRLNPNTRTTGLEVINTLLHEMVHAFKFMCICATASICNFRGCQSLRVPMKLGTTGHGLSWQRLATAVEVAARGRLGVVEVRLGRNRAAVKECSVAPTFNVVTARAFLTECFTGEEIIRVDRLVDRSQMHWTRIHATPEAS